MERQQTLSPGQMASEPPRPVSRHRSAWIDSARGIGIFLVVLAHAERGIIGADMAAETAFSQVMDRTIYTFHMPLFFLLAGLHVGRGMRAGRVDFLLDKLVTIVWPYFLWSTIYIAVNMAAGSVNTPLSLSDLVRIPWQPVAHFWFLYALLLCHLVATAIWPHRWLIVGAAIALAAIWGSGFFLGIVTQMAQMFPFFAMGLLIGPMLLNEGERLKERAPLLAVGGFGLLAAILLAMDRWNITPRFAPLYYVAAAGGIAGVIGISLMIGGRWHWLQRMGQASMAIFVVHTFFAAGLRIGVMKLGIGMDDILLLALSCLFAIGGPWLMYEIFGRRGINPILGLGKYVRA